MGEKSTLFRSTENEISSWQIMSLLLIILMILMVQLNPANNKDKITGQDAGCELLSIKTVIVGEKGKLKQCS